MRYFAGIDLGGTFIKCGIAEETGKILLKDKTPTPKGGYRAVVRAMAKLANRLIEQSGVRPCAVGIDSPGAINSKTGVVLYANNIQMDNAPVGEEMAQLVGLPVFILNDANAAALGESTFGAGSKYSSSVLITLGTGVGSGVTIDGKLFEGNCSVGAELGHTVIRMGGRKCTCGRRGCFEVYASASALVKQTRTAMRGDKSSKMWELCGGNIKAVDGRTVFDGVRAGDGTAKKVFNQYLEYLSEGLANVANAFRPEIILLGGGICAEGEFLIAPLREKFEKKVYGESTFAPVQIAVAQLGNDAGMLGAVKFAMDGYDGK